jgi:serine/threonine protein kinase/Tol biopolymer transport system component
MNTSERWQDVKKLLYAAFEIEPGARAAFLDEKCNGDAELRREVESLIAAHDDAGERFESPAVAVLAETVVRQQNNELTGKRIGNYQVIEKIGEGGMGEVYLARDTRLDRKAAIKILSGALTPDNQTKQRFIQEAKAASALNHPNIVTIYDIASHDGIDFIAMEYVEGETVRDLLERGRIETRKAAELTAQAASALAAAHDAGIIHRDIKPENLMVTRSAQVKILDFGLAKLVEQQVSPLADSNLPTAKIANSNQRVVTVPGTILGTVAYMSPEQAEGRPLDNRSDIFSLGVSFYEMITGERPFQGRSAIDTLHLIINSEPRPVRDVNGQLPLEVEELLAKSLAKEPTERYRHAGDFELDLRRFKRALESGSLVSTRIQREDRPSRDRVSPYWWAGLGALLVIAIAIGAIYLFQRPAADQPAAVAAYSPNDSTLFPLTVDAGFEGEPSFAPDGQTIAYVSDRTGNFEVFLRQISGGPDINLTNNTADDMQPAISPDGKQIAFVSSRSGVSDCLCFFIYGTDQPLMGGAIWVMPTFGGSARKVVETGTFPSWSPDGTALIFTKGPWYGQSIFKVPSNGGEPQEIPLDLKSGAPFIAYPAFSPDGTSILFEAANKIFVVASGGGQPTLLVDGKHPVWSSDGTSIFYTNVEAGKNYTLWQAPFSISAGKLVGEPTPLTVGRGRDTQAAVSRDGKFIAFSALDVSFNLESMPFDAENARLQNSPRPITTGSDLIYFFSSPANSDTAVFDSHRGASSFIWKVDTASPSVQLTSDPRFDDSFPQVSPDGRMIAFNREAPDKPDTPGDLWFMEADGANPRLVIEKAGFVGWLPDGRALTYFSLEDGQLYFYDLASRSSRKLTDEEGVYAKGTPSPDGKWVAYMSIAQGNIDIRAVPIEGGESISVIATDRQDFHPVFSPSGKWLYFQLDHKNIYRVPGPAQGWRKSEPEKVTNFPESGLFLEDPKVSSKGDRLVYSKRRTAGDIWLLSLNK